MAARMVVPKTFHREDSRCRRRRDPQEPGGPRLRREPLLGQALRQESRPRRASSPEEEPRICSEAGRESHEAPGGGPEAEKPSATLREERRDYIHALIMGLSVSRSTICRAVARIGSSRKKGADPRRSAASSEEPPGGRWWLRRLSPRGCSPSTRSAGCIPLLLAPISTATLPQTSAYGCRCAEPGQERDATSASMTTGGMGPSPAVEGATTARVGFVDLYVEKALVPSLRTR
jgi:hypothetical protein